MYERCILSESDLEGIINFLFSIISNPSNGKLKLD